MRPARVASASGFTLLELIVVIAVVGILFALAVPSVLKTVEVGRAAACMSNLRQLGAGLSAYLGEHEMTMPELKAGRMSLSEDLPVIDNTLLRYVRNASVFVCPSDPRFGKESGTSYFWNVALNSQRLGGLDFLRLTDEHSRIPVLSDKEGFHPYLDNKVNVLYADGHATKDLKFVSDPPAK